MSPLKSLQRDYPIIDANFQHFCASHGIFSVEDFLLHDLYVLVAFAERQATSKELKEGITQVLSIIDSQHKPWSNGMELLQDAQWNKHVLSTGCEGIDFLLQGGLRQGQLTELAGPSSSGKTQVCLQAASHIAYKYMGTVMFLDTCNSFSSNRIAHIVSQLFSPTVNKVKERSFESVLSSIFYQSVFDIFTLLDILHQLEFSLRSQVKSEDNRMHLLVIDSISSLISPVLGGKGSHGHSLMVSTGLLLKKLVHEYNLSVLVTNHTVGGEGGISKPALGETWKTIPHVRLLLSREPGSNVYNATVLKHSCMASGRTERFVIHN
ncbi:DNA repair RAD51-like protein [Tasmannia lanceolata]|uniref:DNA repair RAD51-like protein n=1 Tax=Tasmannia lanceolata TaxID=3420 RepID=UPI004063F5E9